jgi:hypothetical protein
LLLLQPRAAAEKFALFIAVSYIFMYVGWLLLSLLKNKVNQMSCSCRPSTAQREKILLVGYIFMHELVLQLHVQWKTIICCLRFHGYCMVSAIAGYVFMYAGCAVSLKKGKPCISSGIANHVLRLFAVIVIFLY